MSCLPQDKIYSIGVYRIINTINNHCYIGSTSSIRQYKSNSGFYIRFKKHLIDLSNSKHHSKYLQNAWNKYGKENFKFEILSICPKEYTFKLEQWYINNLKPEYNIKSVTNKHSDFYNCDKNRKTHGELVKEGHAKMIDKSFSVRAGLTQRGKKKNKLTPHKLTEQGKINNRNKRRLHSHIAKLNVEKVKEIKILLNNKIKLSEIAKMYNVHRGTIQAIQLGKTWLDVKINNN